MKRYKQTRHDSCHLCLIKNYKLINLRRNEAVTLLDKSSFHYWAATSFPSQNQGSKIPKLPTLCWQSISGKNALTRPCGLCGSYAFLQRGLTSAVPCTGALPTSTGLQEPQLGSDRYHGGGMTAPYQLGTDSLGYCWSQVQLSLRLESPKATC